MKPELDENERFQKGMKNRRAVLGDAYVDKALNAMTQFNQPLQQLVTEYCWGDIWGRDGLDFKQRSFINLAMISVLNRPHELRAHVRGALTNGLSREEIAEVFLQVMIYAGVPTAVDSFRIASEVFAEIDAQG
jgi:4-carboxymuconolactone decarboxylase